VATASPSSTTITIVVMRVLCSLPRDMIIADTSSPGAEAARSVLSQNACTSMGLFLLENGLEPLIANCEVSIPIGDADEDVLAEAARRLTVPLW